ncbi:helix-turn-helix domain-containing protein [Actinomadura oligospora]|uniref:helix-turn-helix domain-containing protein n=1 Tax=Actinomadura oligospora TaxID=111804 RepID=UPI00047D55F2|nr:helix-turn-helix transcriptional regulator [Actinomadura oligospora]
MNDQRRSPTVRRRRLGIELRKLRESNEMTAQDVTRSLEWSPGKVTRLEKAQAVKPMVVDTRLLLDLYRVTSDDPRYDELVTLTRQARQRGWWNSYKDVLDDSYVEFEAGAARIQGFQLSVIPGLLQTPEYATSLIRGNLTRDPTEVERLVQLRMRRQELLSDPHPPYFWTVIDASAVMRPFGNVEDQRAQLQRLIDTDHMEHVNIQILPLDVGPHPGLAGSFVVLDFPDEDPSLVYLETQQTSIYLEEREELQRYGMIFQHLSAMALSPDASVAYLKDLAGQLG